LSVAGLKTTPVKQHRHKLHHLICIKLPTFSSREFFGLFRVCRACKRISQESAHFPPILRQIRPIPAENLSSTSQKKILIWAVTVLKSQILFISMQALGSRTRRPFDLRAETTGLSIGGRRCRRLVSWSREVLSDGPIARSNASDYRSCTPIRSYDDRGLKTGPQRHVRYCIWGKE
jgi:hypothetical protein